MPDIDEISPLHPVWPTRPGNRRPVPGKPKQQDPKPKPDPGRDKGDDEHRIDEFALSISAGNCAE